jgi:hypothetical protein
MYYTNRDKTNHNVETYKVKRKEEPIHVVSKHTIQLIKILRLVRYSCYICGDIGHKIIDLGLYSDM